MSKQDNEAIAQTVMRTKGVRVLAWCCNEKVTRKYGLTDMKLLEASTMTIRTSGA